MSKPLHVLLLNGSPRANGNTSIALKELENIFHTQGVETETVLLGNQDIRGCIACYSCKKNGKCIFASPVYFASANATLIACLDRLFYSTSFDKTMKVGASVVCARRGGCSAAFDELNKFFTVSNMPVVSSQYWNSVHGRDMGEAVMDEEGLQTMRTLANNMTFLMKSIALGKEAYGLPEKEPTIHMNFVR